MQQLAIISGKGGTGKTTVTGALATLLEGKVLADCDVDAANLHLLFPPQKQTQEDFFGGEVAIIDRARCQECGRCQEVCRFEAIAGFSVDADRCEGCRACAVVCPTEAISFQSQRTGDIYTAQTRVGPLVYAQLAIGAENSGKLVTQVRDRATALAAADGKEMVLIDGAPGIGCAVIASLTGADLALIVTEPTPSGRSDLERALDLVEHFRITPLICLNKVGLSAQNEEEIRGFCASRGVALAGEIPFDPAVTRALLAGRSIAETGGGPATQALVALGEKIKEYL